MTVKQSDIETIFIEALAIESPEERRSFLQQRCGDNSSLKNRVAALLRAHDDAGSFLDAPPEDVFPTLAGHELDTVDEEAGSISLDFLEPCDKPNRIGQLGQYEVIEVIGRGGMGLVVRALDTKLDRVVAIKIMAPELAANAMAVKRFLREALAAAAVTHDHVVNIHAINDDHRPPYLVMEFVDGQSLQDKIDECGALELREILRIAMQAAFGLAAAHKQGLVHRDIKPANILLENGVERVKITDFGLARAVDDVNITRTGMIAGTPQYMSPEQAQGEAIDHRSDLFALGAVMYAMCTGRPAFRADNPMAVMRRVCDDQPRPIHEINPDIPDWLEAIIAKLLAKNADQRFQSSDEVAELLSQWLAHVQQPALVPTPAVAGCQPVPRAAKKVSTSQHPSPKKGQAGIPSLRRSPIFKLTAAALALLLLLGGALAVIVYLATNNGMLVIESVDPDVQVVVKQDDKQIQIVDTLRRGKFPVQLRVGEYDIEIHGNDQTLKLSDERITIRRGDKVVVRITKQEDVPSPSEIEALMQDAVLALDFDKESFYQHDGKTYVRDVSGNGHVARLQNARYTESGRAGGAIEIDGGDPLADRPIDEAAGLYLDHGLIASGKPFTIAGWIWLEETPKGQRPFFQVFSNISKDDGEGLVTAMERLDDFPMTLAFPKNGLKQGNPGSSSVNFSPARSLNFALGKWGFIAFSRSPDGVLRLTNNGETLEHKQRSGGNDRIPKTSVLGRWLRGRMDEVAIFRRALSAREVNVLYRHGRAGRTLTPSERAASSLDLVRRLRGHTDAIQDLKLTGDGRFLISAGAGEIILRDARTYEIVQTITTQRMRTRAIATNPDATLLATGGHDGTLEIYDLKTGERKLEQHLGASWIEYMKWSPDGKSILMKVFEYPTEGAVVWDVEAGKIVRSLEKGAQAFIFSTDGKWVAAGSRKGEVTIFDFASGKVHRELAHAPRDRVRGLAFSPDSSRLLTGGADGNAKLWDVESGRLLSTLPNKGGVSAGVFLPDGRHAVLGLKDARQLRMWDLDTVEVVARAGDVDVATPGLVLLPDGRHVGTAKAEYQIPPEADEADVIQVWKLPDPSAATGRWRRLFNGRDLTGWKTHPDRPGGWRVEDGVLIGNSDDRAYLFSERGDFTDFHLRAEAKINRTGNSGIFFRAPYGLVGHHARGYEAQILNGTWYWTVTQQDHDMTGSLAKHQRFQERLVAPDEWFTLEVIARGNHIVVKVNGRITADYMDEKRTYTSGHIALQALTKTDPKRHQATVVEFRKIEVRDLTTRPPEVTYEGDLDQVARFSAHTSWINSLAYTSDGARIVSAGQDETLRVWDARSGELLKTIDTHNAPLTIAVSPDGRYVAAGMYRANVVMWNMETGKIARPFVGHELGDHGKKVGRMLAIAFSPDGKTLATGGDDGTVRLWEVNTGKQLRKLDLAADLPADLFNEPFADSPRQPAQTVAFSPDGKSVHAADYAGIVSTWNTIDGKRIHVFQGHKHCAISPDGKWIASGAAIYDGQTFERVRTLHWEEGGNFISHQFTPDSQHLVVGKSNGSLWIFDAASGSHLAVVQCSARVTSVVAVSPDGLHIATGGGSYWSGDESQMILDGDNDVRIWQVPKDLPERSKQATSLRNLKDIGTAFYSYHESRVDGQASFPPAATTDADGKPLLSWRVRLLPFLAGQRELYHQFRHNQPWDSAHNLKLLEKMPDVYATPGADPDQTSVMVFVGDDALFGGKNATRRDRDLQPIPKPLSGPDGHAASSGWSDAPHGEEGGAGKSGGEENHSGHAGGEEKSSPKPRRRGGPWIGEMTDGTSNTVLVIQASADKAVPWTKPEDLPFNPKNAIAALGKPAEEGWLAVLADGSVQTIPADISPVTLERLINPADGQAVEFPERVSDGTDAEEQPTTGDTGRQQRAREEARLRQEKIEAWLIEQTNAGRVRDVRISAAGAVFYFTQPIPLPNLDGASEIRDVRQFTTRLPASEERKRRQMIELLEKNHVNFSFVDE